MKEYIFKQYIDNYPIEVVTTDKQYIDNICNHLAIVSEDLFVKTKEAGVVEARQLLYFLCYTKSNMSITEISKYTLNKGYTQDVSNIKKAITRVEERIATDPDYKLIIKRLDRVEV